MTSTPKTHGSFEMYLVELKENYLVTNSYLDFIKYDFWRGWMIMNCFYGLWSRKLGKNKDVVQMLLDNSYKNIDLNARNQRGLTALMFACSSGHKDVVQMLLDNSEMNIDFNARSDWGLTAFIYACKMGRKDVVKLLVQHSKTKGIDISTGQEDLYDEMRLFISSLQ